jgi:predicted CXXCH cytochrome family protein
MVSAVLGFVFAWSSAMAQISGTPHDFSGRGWGSAEICVFCHAPHNTSTTVAGAPLWNHAVTAQTFTMYSSSTLNATMPAQPAGVSKLCLSCHDGLTAIDSFGTRTGTNFVTGSAALGTNLGNDHPIGFSYNAALIGLDPGLKTPPTTLPRYGASNDTLECATCHNVHSNTLGNFLRSTNAASAMCLQCHNK